MDSDTTYSIMKENKLKNIKHFGDFVTVYELKTSRPLSKKKMKSLGIRFMQ
jgi:hypothetical protein